MIDHTNALGPPIGAPVSGWEKRPLPPGTPMEGRTCRLVPLDVARHAEELYEAMGRDAEGRNWTYLGRETLRGVAAYRAWSELAAKSEDPLFHACVDAVSGDAVGIGAYLRIDPPNGVIEVGHLNFSASLQRRPAASEALYLLMKNAFELGYRRYEWKCDSLNQPSRAAAQRLGMSFEGIFRQAIVYKGRSRDTAWYAAIDSDWPELARAYRSWLAPENFDPSGAQRSRLSDLTAPLLAINTVKSSI